MNPFSVELRGLSVSYGKTTAVDDISLRLEAGAICGLLGRNGAGKTSLLSAVAAFRAPNGGRVLVDGEEPFENARVMAGTCLIREGGDIASAERVSEVLRYASRMRPTWDQVVADRLLERFEIATEKPVRALSRGKRSALGALLGVASRAPLTIFDEVYLGMDAPTRYAFYDELLTEYLQHPRTIILSSHLIGEIERLFEQVIIIDAGRLVLNEAADDLRERGVTVTGPVDIVEEFVIEYTVLNRQRLGSTSSATIYGKPGNDVETKARKLGLELGHVPIQDLFVHLTEGGKEAR